MPPIATYQLLGYQTELMRLFLQMKITYRALMVDEDIDIKVMILLKSLAKHEPNTAYLPITADDIKDHMNHMLNIMRLVEGK